MKLLTAALLIALICAAGLSVATSTGPKSEPAKVISPRKQAKVLVDGATAPEKVPDYVAYSLMFDLIAGRETEAEKNRIRAYLRQALGCNDCGEQIVPKRLSAADDADVEALIAAAEEYRSRVSALDKQADDIRLKHHPDHTPATAEEEKVLKKLHHQRIAIINDIAASLQRRLSAKGLSNVRRHVEERVKRKSKMYAE